MPEIEDPIFAAGTYVGRYIARERKINHDHDMPSRPSRRRRPPAACKHANKTPTIDQQDEEQSENIGDLRKTEEVTNLKSFCRTFTFTAR